MLKVWLPLTGTLENQGVSAYQAVGTDLTVDNSGKIGKCYSFNGTSSKITVANFSIGNNWSYGAWIYSPTSSRGWEGAIILNTNGGDADMQLGFYTYPTGNRIQSTANGQYNSGISMTYGQWNHLFATFDGSNLKTYINGVLVNTKAITNSQLTRANLTIGARCRGSSYDCFFSGKINDVRIYDHCLSAAEVREISQGLVLHYKLDGFQGGLGNPNLYTGSRDFSGTWVNGNIWTVASEIYQGFTVKQRSATWGGLCQNVPCTQNDIFTVSFYGKVDNGGNIQSVHRSNLGNVTTGLTILGGNFSSGVIWVQNTEDGSQWKRYWATVKITGADVTYLQWRIENSVNGKNCYICGMKLEKGSSETGWTPAASESIFNIIQDSSGYGHNGTIVGDLILNSETKRYSVSTKWNSSSPTDNSETGICYIQTPITLTTPLQMSIAWWAKPESGYGGSTTHAAVCTSNSASRPTDYNTTAFHHRDSGFDIYPSDGSGVKRLSFTYTKNEWHHYAITYDGTTARSYQDGVEKTSVTVGTNKTLATFSQLYIGYSQAGGARRKTLGSYSDFRIYCTALSADDILSLYHTAAKVDNLQNLHTFEIKETNRNLLAGRLWSNGYSQHNPNAGLFTNFNSKGEYQFTANGTSAGTEYIPINPTGHTYEYDYTISVNAGNQFYIGFERYDANKTARSNNACVYTYATKPSSDVVKQHFKGVVNLSTDGTNPCAFIALRILNGWSGTTSGITGTATIHNISLREIGVKQQPKLTKQGQFIEEELKEEVNMKLHQNGIIEVNNLIEF